MTDSASPYSAFRLNLEQQRKRAKDLLRAAHRGEPAALARLSAFGAAAPTPGDTKLSAAQFTIARELRFRDWPALRRHIEVMTQERAAMEAAAEAAPDPGFALHTGGVHGRGVPLDADARTLHIRCGSDIERTLRDAGFVGDFYEHSYPYLIGPVSDGPGALPERARFLASSYAGDFEPPLVYTNVLHALEQAEQRLHDSAGYDRAVIWSEHDCFDQLVLVRLLGHYAEHRRPPSLELVFLDEFPGSARFLGLGQLPPEALRVLWRSRAPIDDAQLSLGLAAWRALASADPGRLAAIARSGTPALPSLAPALRRHLSELPAVTNGLSATESMALTLLAEHPTSLGSLFRELTDRVDWLPGQGDLQVRDRVLAMEHAAKPLIERSPRGGRSPWSDVLAITETGRAVLRGEIDYLSLEPPARWVGGVEVGPGRPDWRWDGASVSAVRRREAAGPA